MIKCVVSDFSRVLLFPKDKSYAGKLNDLHRENLASGDYDFWQKFELDQELLDYYESLSRDCGVYIFTSEYIQNYPPIRRVLDSVFRKIFIALDMGIKKDDPRAYQKLAELLDCKPEEIIFVDDSAANVVAANQAGIKAILYKTTAQAISEIKGKLVS